MTMRDDLVKEHRAFNKWYAGKYADPDGKFLHMPSWLKNDMRNAWLASAHESQSRISDLERQLAEETERCACIADSFTCGACGMDGKAAAAIRGSTSSPSQG